MPLDENITQQKSHYSLHLFFFYFFTESARTHPEKSGGKYQTKFLMHMKTMLSENNAW